MAVLSSVQLNELQRKAAKKFLDFGYDKPTLNLAAQAMEDWFEANKADGSAAVEAAVPGVFTNGEKLTLFAIWMVQRAARDGGV